MINLIDCTAIAKETRKRRSRADRLRLRNGAAEAKDARWTRPKIIRDATGTLPRAEYIHVLQFILFGFHELLY